MGEPIRTVAPAVLPVSLEELKAQCRVLSDDEGALLTSYLRAAVENVERFTGLGLIAQTWTQTFSAFSSPMLLRRRPLLAVGSPAVAATVAYLDADGVSQAVSASSYRVTGIGDDHALGAIRLPSGQSWPTALADDEAVTVTYTVGFGATAEDVPELIRIAILLTAATWFNYREDVVPDRVSEVPGASKSLLRDWRPLAVA